MSEKYQKENIEKLLESLKGGVIMDVTDAKQAKIAEDAGAVAVMALYKVPADIRKEGGVARTASVDKIEEIVKSVSIPVMAKARIGHYGEASMLEALGIDFIDESEVLTVADPFFHIDKKKFNVPFVCGAREFGEAVRRIFEGAAMIRTKGEAGTGDVVEAVRHARLMNYAIKEISNADDKKLEGIAKKIAERYYNLAKQVNENFEIEIKINDNDIIFSDYSYKYIKDEIYKILSEIKENKRFPVVNFAAGGIATPADAAYMMKLGVDGIFVGSAIFKSEKPKERAKAMVMATKYWNDPAKVLEASRNLGEEMKSIATSYLEEKDKTQFRGER